MAMPVIHAVVRVQQGLQAAVPLILAMHRANLIERCHLLLLMRTEEVADDLQQLLLEHGAVFNLLLAPASHWKGAAAACFARQLLLEAVAAAAGGRQVHFVSIDRVSFDDAAADDADDDVLVPAYTYVLTAADASALLQNASSLALFATHSRCASFEANTLDYIWHLATEFEAVIVLTNQDRGMQPAAEALPANARIALVPDCCLDFGMFWQLLRRLSPQHWAGLCRVGLFNDSCLIVRPLAPVFDWARACCCGGFWGLTRSFEVAEHLQSCFLVFDRPHTVCLLRSFVAETDVAPFAALSKMALVIAFEVGLSQYMAARGVHMASRWDSLAQLAATRALPVSTNPMFHMWPALLLAGCPLVKKKRAEILQIMSAPSMTMPQATKLPLSGSEPDFALMPWGTTTGVRGSNCYDYSLNDYRTHRPVKTTPGDKAWDAPTKLVLRQHARYDKCMDVVPGILADNPGAVYREAAWNPCKQGFAKIQAFVGGPREAGGDYGDFHFYRQNKDAEVVTEAGDTPASIARFLGVPELSVLRAVARAGVPLPLPVGTALRVKGANVWSHKAGWATGALLKDSCGKAIHDPRKACREGAVDYTKYCGSYCVRVGTTSSAAAVEAAPERQRQQSAAKGRRKKELDQH